MAKKDRDESNSSEAVRRRRASHFMASLKTEDAAAYLEGLAQALRDNRLVVQTPDETLDVRVGSRVSLEIDARSSRGGRRSSVELKLDWAEPDDVSALSISSGSASDDDDMETVSSSPPAGERTAEEVAQAAEERQEAGSGTPPASIWTSGAE
jgi:amphi-Trp domain-containing protein